MPAVDRVLLSAVLEVGTQKTGELLTSRPPVCRCALTDEFLRSVQTASSFLSRSLYSTSSKTPGGRSRDTHGHTGHTDHTDEPHNQTD